MRIQKNGKICRICGSNKLTIEYDGIIRDGATTSKTKDRYFK